MFVDTAVGEALARSMQPDIEDEASSDDQPAAIGVTPSR